jgi:hypothetical protein
VTFTNTPAASAPTTNGVTAALWFIALALIVVAGAAGFHIYKTWFADEATAAPQPGDLTARLDDISGELRTLRLAFCQINELSTGECAEYFAP